MLARYFGFVEDPFGATPDPRYLYSSRTHREALASLHYAFYSNRGFTALIAPPGMGKTTLLFEFMHHIRNAARTAFLFNSQCDPADLLRDILSEVGVAPQDGTGRMLQQLNAELVETARSGHRFVVIVDEAQNLSEEALEMLRLLTNFETARSKLMQIVLSGQPGLRDTLLRPGLLQLRQRISTFSRLEPFAASDTESYMLHRLKIAGYQGDSLFTSDAMARIAEVSGGIPRNINTLCFNALSLCCAMKKKNIDLRVLTETFQDLEVALQPSSQQEGAAAEIPRYSGTVGERRPKSRVSRVLRPALAFLLLLGLFVGFSASHVYAPQQEQVNRLERSGPSQSSPLQPGAAEARAAEKDPVPNAIEITVDPEQTLSDISVRTLGAFDAKMLRQIEALNPDLADPNLIHPGQKILLPNQRNSPDPDVRKQNEQKF